MSNWLADITGALGCAVLIECWRLVHAARLRLVERGALVLDKVYAVLENTNEVVDDVENVVEGVEKRTKNGLLGWL